MVLAQSFLDLIVPIVGSVISSVSTTGMTYTFLDDMLQEIKDDAVPNTCINHIGMLYI
jgi:uncharacterized protein (DUF697 family)